MNRRVFILVLLCFYGTIGVSQILYENQEESLIAGDPMYGVVTTNGLGSGISFFDYDNDGWDDITIPASANNDFQFYRNVEGTFIQQNLPIHSGGVQSRQAIWVDYDNDGDNDFFATSDTGICWFYRNDGDNIFTDITVVSGLPLEQVQFWGVSWGDYNNDGFLDVFLSVRDNAQLEHNELYRNNGDGTFTNRTVAAGIDETGFITFCSSFFDYDNDGDQDIYMANDKCITSNILYRNNGDNTFTDVSEAADVNLFMSAMSTTIDDYNNDGWLDIYVTNFYPSFEEDATTGNAFLQNNGDGTFSNIALDNGTQFDSIGWGAVFLDADNDTDKDLYVSGSLDDTDIEGRMSAAFYEQNENEEYSVVSNSGFQNDNRTSFANAIGDIQNDGLPDMLVLNTANQPIFLWENKTENNNNWIKIQLQGTESNRMGIGSTIKVFVEDQIYYGYTLCGEGYIAQNSNREFFGLRDAINIDAIEVHWLSGQIDRIENVTVNQTLTMVEGENPLSIGDLERQTIAIFPNPATNSIRINGLNSFNGGTMTIYDVLGKEILQRTIDNETMQIDISSLKQELYIVEAFKGTQKFVSRFIHL